MSQVKHESFDDNGDGIRSIGGSEWTLETTSIGTIGDGKDNSMNSLLLEVPFITGYSI
jgi:hypothetical protein